jgi:hypothetical protein
MSLSQKITSRSYQDLINEGLKTTITGTKSGAVTNSVLLDMPSNRFFILTGYSVSTDSAAAILVSLSLKKDAIVVELFTGYIALGSGIVIAYSPGDWRYGDLDYDLVITTSGGNVAYTVDGRISSSPTPLGYIEHDGSPAHTQPWFPDAGGKNRGQSEF